MPHKPASLIRHGLGSPTAWRAVSGAALGISASRLNPVFRAGGEGGRIFGCLVGRMQGSVFAESAPRLKRGRKDFRKNYSLLREYNIPFRGY